MNKDQRIIVMEKPESSNFIVYRQSTSSQYITFKNDSSVDPSSLDQLMKNKVIVFTPVYKDFLKNESSGKPY